MLISLEWIRDYVDLPADIDPRGLAERFTRTSAEVEGVERIKLDATGLIAARVETITPLPGTRNLHLAKLDLGHGKTVETVTAAPVIHVGDTVVYAPDGASIATIGAIGSTEVAGHRSEGMILPGDALGIEMAAQEAVFLCGDTPAGQPLDPKLFDDWIIEVDNKSLTHRPDMWGHYGIAREIAAICKLPLKPYPVVDMAELADDAMPEIPISIADGSACRRYSGLLLGGVPTQPAPLWMQLRLGRTGLRPISGLVDLTNYIMTDLGQPMHAFDAAKADTIEVDWSTEDETFRTLDGTERKLTDKELMIQCQGHSIALAGVMGGIETEVTESTAKLLLESANFDPATIRRTATRLGLRTDASARFEKSLDPTYTALAIQRFVHLARPVYPDMKIESRFSDCFPSPHEATTVSVNPRHVARSIGKDVSLEEAGEILRPLGFTVSQADTVWDVGVPSYRATNDVSIEADVIEELARYIGYGTIAPAMPQISMRRFEANALHELQQRTLEYFTTAHRFNEIHGYLWYDSAWLAQIGVDPGPCVELRNPAAEGLHRFRQTIMPGMLAATARNRFHFTEFSLIELGSVFEKGTDADHEHHHVGLILAQRGKRAEERLHGELKGAIEAWAWQQFARQVTFSRAAAAADHPWEHPHQTASVVVDDVTVGRTSVVDMALKRAMDEHLASWSIAWAELRLDGLETLEHATEPLGRIPEHPLVEMDFSIQVTKTTPYAEAVAGIKRFEHPLIKLVRYVGAYEGGSVESDKRSLTFRVVVGDDNRTLVDDDTNALRSDFEKHLKQCGYEIRA